MFKRLILFSTILSTLSVCAQEETSAGKAQKTGFYYGLQMGGYFPNQQDAQFYSGRPENSNSIEQRLWNSIYLEKIEEEVGDRLAVDMDGKLLVEFKTPVKYKTAVLAGAHAGYILNKGLTIIANINYVRTTALSQFKVFKTSPIDKNEFDNSVTGTMVAEESRAIIELGLHQPFLRPKSWHPFVEGGVCAVMTEVLNHEMQIESVVVDFSIREGSIGSNINQGGASVGYYMNAGLDFPVSEKFSGAIGGGFANYSVPLPEEYEPTLHFSCFVRLLFL